MDAQLDAFRLPGDSTHIAKFSRFSEASSYAASSVVDMRTVDVESLTYALNGVETAGSAVTASNLFITH